MRRKKGPPKSVRVISLFFKICAVLLVLLFISNFMIYLFMKSVMSESPFPGEFEVSPVWQFILRNFGLFSAIQLLLGIAVYITASEFLKLRQWAKTSLEILSWLWTGGLLYLVIRSGDLLAPNVPESLAVGFRVVIGICSGCMIIPLVIIIFFLRGTVIREAFAVEKSLSVFKSL